jgi:hypothetical protein
MDHKKLFPLMNSLSRIVQIVGFLLIAVSLISLYFTLTNSWSSVVRHFPSLFPHQDLKGAIKQLGSFGEYTVIGTAAYWLCKTLLVQMKKKNSPLTDGWLPRMSSIVQKAMLFFKKQHQFLGWVTVMVASGHGLYFILFPDKKLKFFYTGIAALIGLILAAGVGIVFDQLMKRNKAVKAGRRYHFAAAVLFAVLFLVHLYY